MKSGAGGTEQTEANLFGIEKEICMKQKGGDENESTAFKTYIKLQL